MGTGEAVDFDSDIWARLFSASTFEPRMLLEPCLFSLWKFNEDETVPDSGEEIGLLSLPTATIPLTCLSTEAGAVFVNDVAVDDCDCDFVFNKEVPALAVEET